MMPAAAADRNAHMVDVMAEFMARVMGMRPCMYVRSSNFLSWVSADPPTHDPSRPRCRSCGGVTSRKRVLCAACRSNPMVIFGAPVVDTMFRSSNPLYEMNAEKQRAILYLKREQKLAEHSLALAELLADWAWRVRRRKLQGGDGNVYFTPELVWGCGSYGTEMRCGYNRRVVFGGLGGRLHDEVRQLAVEWLNALDAHIREHFEIPLDHAGMSDVSLMTCIENFAVLIANRVTLFESAEMDASQRLCSEGCEHIARMQYLRCEFFARKEIVRDIAAMRALMQIAREGTAPLDPRPLLHLLQSPPPELLALLPSVATDWDFGTLRDTLGTGLDPDRLEAWRASVPSESLCLLLERAIAVAQAWRPPPSGFLKTLRMHDAPRPNHVPLMDWVDAPTVAHWSLLPRKLHEHRRVGLDPTAERIVLLSSALMQMDAHERCFVPGIASWHVISLEAQREMDRASHALRQLTEQMRPFTVGIEWDTSRRELMDWKASHLEDDMRQAATLLGGYSVQELRERFLRDGNHRLLLQPATERMLCKPRRGYETWCEASLAFLLPILQQHRESIGFADNVATTFEGDVLRLLPVVREWTPEAGALCLTAGEVRSAPTIVKNLLERLKAAGVITYKRQRRGGTKMEWTLEVAPLMRMLS